MIVQNLNFMQKLNQNERLLMKSLIFFLTLSIYANAQVESSGTYASKFKSPPFYYELINYSSKIEGKTRVDILVQVPYSTIQFIKSSFGFTGSFLMTVTFYDQNKERILHEKSWSESLSTNDFAITTSRHNYHYSLKSADLSPGDYLIKAELYDRDSKTTYSFDDKFTVRDLSDKISISDILFVDKYVEREGEKIMVPNISRNVAYHQKKNSFYYEVYSDTVCEITALYEIQKEGTTIYKGEENLFFNSYRSSFSPEIENQEFNIGVYNLNITLKDNSGQIIAAANKLFYSQWFGLPLTEKDLAKSIDQMIYIASSDEIKYIRTGDNLGEKTKRYIEFWKRKDPNPDTEENPVFEEYYRRVAYANEKFKHYMEGWKTDMGMIFITLGSPDNVERHPFEFDSKPYEIWYYYDINQKFIFVDNTGFGDYRLINPVYGHWFKYRQ